jgi:hypothetical protein
MQLGRAHVVPVGSQVIAHLVPSAPSLPGLLTGSGAMVPLHSLLQPAQALGAFHLEAGGQRLLAHAEGLSVHKCECRYRSPFCML